MVYSSRELVTGMGGGGGGLGRGKRDQGGIKALESASLKHF